MKNSNKTTAALAAHDTSLPDTGATGAKGAQDNVIDLSEQLAREQAENAQQPIKFNDAEVLGDHSLDLTDFLAQEFTFMLGDLYPKERFKGTKDGEWKPATATLSQWLKGDGKTRGLSVHPEGKTKDGASLVPSFNFEGTRTDKAVQKMYAIGIDIDAVTSLDHTIAKLEEAGIFAIVYTTFNHMSETLELKHDEVMRKLRIDATPTRLQIQEYLTQHHSTRFERDFIQEIEVVESRKQTKDGQVIVLKVPPIDKFRVVIPLAEPVELADLAPTLQQWKTIWADAVTGVCVNMLDAVFDTASCDVNRLFYTPRHPKGDKNWYSAIIMGKPLRFEDIEQYSRDKYVQERKAQGDPFSAGTEGGGENVTWVTASGMDLNQWHRIHKERFQIADVIETYTDDRIRAAGGEKYGTLHVECPFEHEHSTQGGTATMVMNPDANEHGYWTAFCRHDSCNGRHKLHFLQEMIAQGWFEEDVLPDAGFNLPSNEDDSFETAPLGADEKRGFYDPLFDSKLVENGWIIGEGDKLQSNIKKIRAQMRQSMAEMFSFVIVDGGDARVILQPSRGESPVFWKDTALTKAFKNRHVAYPNGEKTAQIDPAAEFMCDPFRKTYLGTHFEPDPAKTHPDLYNLWTGFKAEPVEGDWSLLRDHIRDQIIAGNGKTKEEDEALCNFFITFLADIFQNPGVKPGCAVGLLGEQGTGKSTLFDIIREAVGAAAVKLSHRKHLVGNFNAILDAKILAIAEEAFWSGDKEAAGVLKDLISSDKITIEQKGIDATERANNLRFVFISNEKWVIPTQDNGDARRFFVLRVNNNKKNDTAHFAAIHEQMKNGGLEAMVYELMHWDPLEHGLTWASLRNPPMTAAKQEQASYGLSGPKAALMSIIQGGVLSGVAKDGTPFTYDLSDDADTPVLKEHLVAAIQGRDTHGGAAKAAGGAIKDLLGEEADQGDSKKGVEFCNPRLASAGDEGLVVKKGRWVKVPPLGGLREELAKTYK